MHEQYPLTREYLEDLKTQLYVARSGAAASQHHPQVSTPEGQAQILFYQGQAEDTRERIAEIETLLQHAADTATQRIVTMAAAVGGALAIVILVVLVTLAVNALAAGR
ncbi:MAG: hypothetical protein U0X20_23740 [Caldilineaceae bacterium]